MSHSISVTQTTTTSTSTAIILNTGILSTTSGLLKLIETINGALCLGLISYYNSTRYGFIGHSEHIFFLLVTFAFLVTTFLLLVSFLLSPMAASMLPKTIFEFLYQLFAFIFYTAASLALMVFLSNYKRYEYHYGAKMAAAALGLVNAVLYSLSTFFSFKSYRMT